VYTMIVTGMLFPNQPFKAAGVFTAAYVMGISAALGMAWLFKRTILRGESKPLVLELPSYKTPSVRNAVTMMLDRAWVFLWKAGTVILTASIILWALATYPKSDPPARALALERQAAAVEKGGDQAGAQELRAEAERLTSQSALANSAAGRGGRLIEPVLRPMGFNWQIGVGIISSFAAREVIVSTLAVVYGVGEDAAKQKPDTLYQTMLKATRDDGSKLFTTATALSLLVFYILAMQCISTLAVTRRETNSWKWPIFQQVYMSLLAFGMSTLTYQLLTACGVR
jgi:ferrous iron transport protein B